MAREEFIDSLRVASRLLLPPTVSGDPGSQNHAHLSSLLHRADLWLTPKSVEGFNSADFRDWPKDQRTLLEKEVTAFRSLAKGDPGDKPATNVHSKQARKHLDTIIKIVRSRLLDEWQDAQKKMLEVATTAAKAKGWYVDVDEKEIQESLLGAYKSPRLRIRTQNHEVVFDPIARFGSGRQGIVDLVVMPTYETVYLITFKNGAWQIVSRQGRFNARPFTQATLVNTIAKLPRL